MADPNFPEGVRTRSRRVKADAKAKKIKEIRQTSKKIFDFARCEWVLSDVYEMYGGKIQHLQIPGKFCVKYFVLFPHYNLYSRTHS